MLSKANVAAFRELNCDYLLAARLVSIADDEFDKLLPKSARNFAACEPYVDFLLKRHIYGAANGV